VEPLAIGVEHPGFEPLLKQSQQRAVSTPRGQHPDHPGLVNGVKDLCDVGVDDPGVSAAWACDGPCIHGLQGATLRTIPIATAPDVLLLDRV
jgi:hypothetical protein